MVLTMPRNLLSGNLQGLFMIKDRIKFSIFALCAIIVLSGIGALVLVTHDNWVVTTIKNAVPQSNKRYFTA